MGRRLATKSREQRNRRHRLKQVRRFPLLIVHVVVTRAVSHDAVGQSLVAWRPKRFVVRSLRRGYVYQPRPTVQLKRSQWKGGVVDTRRAGFCVHGACVT